MSRKSRCVLSPHKICVFIVCSVTPKYTSLYILNYQLQIVVIGATLPYYQCKYTNLDQTSLLISIINICVIFFNKWIMRIIRNIEEVFFFWNFKMQTISLIIFYCTHTMVNVAAIYLGIIKCGMFHRSV